MASCFEGITSGSRGNIFRFGPPPFPTVAKFKFSGEPASRSVLLLSALEEEADLSSESPVGVESLNSERTVIQGEDSEDETSRDSVPPSPVKRMRQASLEKPCAGARGVEGSAFKSSFLEKTQRPDASLHGLSLRCKGTWPSGGGRRSQSSHLASERKEDSQQPGAKLLALLKKTSAAAEQSKTHARQTDLIANNAGRQSDLVKKSALAPPLVPRLDLSRLCSKNNNFQKPQQPTRPSASETSSVESCAFINNASTASQQDSEKAIPSLDSLSSLAAAKDPRAVAGVRTAQTTSSVASAASWLKVPREEFVEAPRLSLQQRLALLIQNARLEKTLGTRFVEASKARSSFGGLHFDRKGVTLGSRSFNVDLKEAPRFRQHEANTVAAPSASNSFSSEAFQGREAQRRKTFIPTATNERQELAVKEPLREVGPQAQRRLMGGSEEKLRGVDFFREMLETRQRRLLQNALPSLNAQNSSSWLLNRSWIAGGRSAVASKLPSSTMESVSAVETMGLSATECRGTKTPPSGRACAVSSLEVAVANLRRKFEAHKLLSESSASTASSSGGDSRQQSASSFAESSVAVETSAVSSGSQLRVPYERSEARSLSSSPHWMPPLSKQSALPGLASSDCRYTCVLEEVTLDSPGNVGAMGLKREASSIGDLRCMLHARLQSQLQSIARISPPEMTQKENSISDFCPRQPTDPEMPPQTEGAASSPCPSSCSSPLRRKGNLQRRGGGSTKAPSALRRASSADEVHVSLRRRPFPLDARHLQNSCESSKETALACADACATEESPTLRSAVAAAAAAAEAAVFAAAALESRKAQRGGDSEAFSENQYEALPGRDEWKFEEETQQWKRPSRGAEWCSEEAFKDEEVPTLPCDENPSKESKSRLQSIEEETGQAASALSFQRCTSASSEVAEAPENPVDKNSCETMQSPAEQEEETNEVTSQLQETESWGKERQERFDPFSLRAVSALQLDRRIPEGGDDCGGFTPVFENSISCASSLCGWTSGNANTGESVEHIPPDLTFSLPAKASSALERPESNEAETPASPSCSEFTFAAASPLLGARKAEADSLALSSCWIESGNSAFCTWHEIRNEEQAKEDGVERKSAALNCQVQVCVLREKANGVFFRGDEAVSAEDEFSPQKKKGHDAESHDRQVLSRLFPGVSFESLGTLRLSRGAFSLSSIEAAPPDSLKTLAKARLALNSARSEDLRSRGPCESDLKREKERETGEKGAEPIRRPALPSPLLPKFSLSRVQEAFDAAHLFA